MKKALFIILSLILFIGCENAFRDEMQELHSEIDQLKERLDDICNQMNSEINLIRSILTSLENNDYVTGVTPIYENGERIGYTLTFSKSGSVSIFDGKKGDDGYTPQIGVKLGEDGVYYWIVDGEWMLDKDGNRIKASGTDGDLGVTPKMKIEEDYWYVSYDDGKTWTKLEKATGEQGDSFFSSIDCTDPNYVIITLADGEMITVPTWSAFEVHKQVYEKQVNEIIYALQNIISALEEKDFVTGITPIYEGTEEIGYTISFSKSGNITIFNGKNGDQGSTPQIGVKLGEDGVYYWTVDGEWMLDNDGNRIKASGTDGNQGITPKMKIEEDYWYVSYDDGKTWAKLEKATGEQGDSFFGDVRITDDSIVFVLSDGTEITFPRRGCFNMVLNLDGDVTGVLPGRQINIRYTLQNVTSKTTVTASSDGRYAVNVVSESETEGYVVIDCPLNYKDGYVNIIACDETGYTVLRVISFYEEKMELKTGFEYHIAPEGGSVKIPFRSNFEYDIKVDGTASSWLKVVETRAPEMKDAEIEAVASMNESFSSRTGKIYIYPTNSMYSPYTEITINQASAEFSLSQSKYAVKSEGDVLVTEIKSTQGLTVKVADKCTWIRSTITESKGNSYILETEVQANTTGQRRNTSIQFFSGNGDILLGVMEIVQVASEEEDPNAMIFIVRPNYINEFKVDLPLYGEYDCYVDWGDGVIEYFLFREKPDVVHIYDTPAPTSYVVKIVGNVPAINSRNVKAHSIEEVIQWGATGLTSMADAFNGNHLLKKIAGDDSGAFSNVTSMSGAFTKCQALREIPENLLWHCPANLELGSIFRGCKNLSYIPEDLFIKQTETVSFNEVFEDCANITEIPEGLFRKNINAISFDSAFSDCHSIEGLPAGLFMHNPWVTSLYSTFNNCSNLKHVPVSIFDNNARLDNLERLFLRTELEGESPYSIINGVKYHLYERYLASDYFVTPSNTFYCFWGCGGLTDYNIIPDSFKDK